MLKTQNTSICVCVCVCSLCRHQIGSAFVRAPRAGRVRTHAHPGGYKTIRAGLFHALEMVLCVTCHREIREAGAVVANPMFVYVLSVVKRLSTGESGEGNRRHACAYVLQPVHPQDRALWALLLPWSVGTKNGWGWFHFIWALLLPLSVG
ncbi:unnamed protein product, partial [Ectocarpus sp. 6 AP-2014]